MDPRTNEWQEAAVDLAKFRKSAEAVTGDLVREYANKWVAIYDGEVCAVADDLDTLLGALDQMVEVTRSATFVHFMETEPKTLILASAPG